MLGAGAIAGIAIGGVIFCALMAGMIFYVIRNNDQNNVVVVDRNGKKVKQKRARPQANNAAGTMMSARTMAANQSNPAPDGLFYCSLAGNPTCNRAYYSQDELNQHIQKRHGGNGAVTVTNAAFGAPPMQTMPSQNFGSNPNNLDASFNSAAVNFCFCFSLLFFSLNLIYFFK